VADSSNRNRAGVAHVVEWGMAQETNITDSRLRIVIDREDKRGEMQFLTGSKGIPADAQKTADSIVRAAIMAEQQTGVRFRDIIAFEPKKNSIRVRPTTDGKAPELFIGYDFIVHPERFNEKDIKAVFLHELGHQNYAPLMDVFKKCKAYWALLSGVEALVKEFREQPDVATARIMRFYDAPEDFQRDLQKLRELLLKHEPLIHSKNPLRTSSDEQVASWLADGQKRLFQNKPMAQPLKALAEVPDISSEANDIAERLQTCCKQRLKETDKANFACHQDVIAEILQKTTPPLLTAFRFYKESYSALRRGEEYLCDDYAVMHDDKPYALAEALEKFSYYSGASRDVNHPDENKRILRCTELGRRVEASRHMCGAAPLEPAKYGDWVHKTAHPPMPDSRKSSSDSRPSSTLAPRTHF